jgi:hypothetical protein
MLIHTKEAVLKILAIVVCFVFFSSCNKNKVEDEKSSSNKSSNESDDDDDDDDDDSKEGTDGAGTLQINGSLDDLELSKSLTASLPETSTGSGPGVESSQVGTIQIALAGNKSQGACEVSQTIQQSTDFLDNAGFALCELETSSDQIEFGKKYHMNFIPEIVTSIFVDDSDEDKLIVNVCEDNKLRYKITFLTAMILRIAYYIKNK